MDKLKLIDRFGNTNIKQWLDFFHSSQYWSKDEINNHQLDRLSKILNHCYLNVPFYKEYFKINGLVPSDFKTVDDLKHLPIIRKDTVKRKPHKFISTNSNIYNPIKKRTGGSTGEPFEYYNDKELRSIQWALKLLSWERGGYMPGDRMAVMGGGSLFPRGKKSYKHIVRNKLNQFYSLPMTHYSKDIVNNYASIIERKDIKYIRGYPSAIATFAELAKLKNTKIKAVFTTAEVLTKDFREVIETKLKTKVFDQYGCADAGAHASECEAHSGLHLFDEILISELVNNHQPVNSNEEGELIFTSLYNFSMPLLRYAPEDLAVEDISLCKCGRKTKKLLYISGRTTDVIRLSNGSYISGPALTLIFSRVNVDKYQIIQNKIDEIELLIIPNVKYTSDDQRMIIESLSYHCGKGIKIKIFVVNEIPLPESGKFRFIISKI